MIRDITNRFEHEHYYEKLLRKLLLTSKSWMFGVIIILNTKVMMIEIKHYQLGVEKCIKQ